MVKPAILFLTNSELGQASVCLAVAHELLARQNTVHVASFTSLSNAVSALNARVSQLSSSSTSATFHPISGLPMREAVSQKWSLDIFNIHNVGFWGALRAYKNVLSMSVPWDGPQYMEIYHSCIEIIKRTKPEVIVVDPLLGQAKDACRALGRRYIILSPNTFKEHVPQPWLANFWKYPQLCSGYPYPLPWWLILLNVYLTIRLAAAYMFAPEIRATNEYRNVRGIPDHIPNIISEAHDKVPLLLQTHPTSVMGARILIMKLYAGVPQVVLPVWFDTYDFAARVEYLGIGVYGNRKTAPAVNGRELGGALNRVLASGESEVMLQKAKMIASKLGRVEGRVVACEKILTLSLLDNTLAIGVV